MVTAAQALVASRSQRWRMRGEVQAATAGLSEQAQVPHVAVALRFDVGVGEADPVDGEAGEANVVGVTDLVEVGEVELGHRRDTAGPELIDPRPHPAGDDADLFGGSAADRVQQLEANQRGQPTQAQHPAVDRLAHPGRPAGERTARGAAVAPPRLVVDLTQPALAVRRGQVAAGRRARPEVGQRPGPSDELLEADPACLAVAPTP